MYIYAYIYTHIYVCIYMHIIYRLDRGRPPLLYGRRFVQRCTMAHTVTTFQGLPVIRSGLPQPKNNWHRIDLALRLFLIDDVH